MLSPNNKNAGRFVIPLEIPAQPARRCLESSDDGATRFQLLERERQSGALQHQLEFLFGRSISIIRHGSSP
jgi:hypothetical protein